MGLNNSNKTISIDRIDCSGSLKVTLALSASPDISSTPTDIVLVLDRSGSMAGSPLAKRSGVSGEAGNAEKFPRYPAVAVIPTPSVRFAATSLSEGASACRKSLF